MSISNALDPSSIARAVGIEMVYKNLKGSAPFLPQRIALMGQGTTSAVYPNNKQQYTSATAIGAVYGYGSPLHLAAKQLFPLNGDGVGTIPVTVYPLIDADDAVAAAGEIAVSGTQLVTAEYYVLIGGVQSKTFAIEPAEAASAIVAKMVNAIVGVLDMPVSAASGTGKVGITCKWAGKSGNNITVSVVGSTTAGTHFTVTKPFAGAVEPAITEALAQIGSVWETIVINCGDAADTTNLNLLKTWGEGRWHPLTRKPAIIISGIANLTAAGAVSAYSAQAAGRSNVLIPVPGSPNLPCLFAAAAAMRIARMANSNPAQSYYGLVLSDILPGQDSLQWAYADREVAVQGGICTTEVRDSQVVLGDIITTYHPSGDALPAYRYVVQIVKLQQAQYRYALEFDSPEWAGAPLIPNDQFTTNPTAKSPKMAVAAACAINDGLAEDAIISSPEEANASTVAGINGTNPNRLDLATTLKLSGNCNQESVTINFGFNFGTGGA